MRAHHPVSLAAGATVLGLLVTGAFGCREEEPEARGPRPIDPTEVRAPSGPPENLERLRRQPEAPGYRQEMAAEAAARAETVPARPARPSIHHEGLGKAADLVPANAAGALLVGSPRDGYARLMRVLDQLSEAGIVSARPDRLGPEVQRLLGTNALAPQALESGGLDLDLPAAMWWRDRQWVLAVAVADPERVEALVGRLMAARASLPGGCRQQTTRGPSARVACVADGDVVVGFTTRGPYVLLHGGRGGPAAFNDILAAPNRTLRDHADFSTVPLPDAPATLFMRPARNLWGGVVHLGLLPDRGAIEIRGTSTRQGVPLGEGAAPFGGLERAEALLTLRANLSGLLPLIESLVPSRALADACPRCPRAELEAFVEALVGGLTGGSALLVRGLDASCCPGERRPGDAWFTTRHGWLAIVSDEAVAERLLGRAERLFQAAGLTPQPAERRGEGGRHLVVSLGGGGSRQVFLGHRGDVIYLGSDGTAIDAALTIGQRPGGAALSLRIDPVILARNFADADAAAAAAATADDGEGGGGEPMGALAVLQSIIAELGRVDDRLLPMVLTAEPRDASIRIQARMPLPRGRSEHETDESDW
jgi:hypothetical protein